MKSVRLVKEDRRWRVLLAVPAAVVTLGVLVLPFWARPMSPEERSRRAALTATEVLEGEEPDLRRAMVVVRTAVAADAPANRLRDAELLDGVGLLASERGEAPAAVKWRRDADHCLERALEETGMVALPDAARRAYLGMRVSGEWALLAEAVPVVDTAEGEFVSGWLQVMGGKAGGALKMLEPRAEESPRHALLAAVAAHAVQETEVRDRMAAVALAGKPELGPLERAGAAALVGRFEEAFGVAAGAGVETEPVRSAAIAEIVERWLRSGTFPAPASKEARDVLETGLRAAPDSPYLAAVVVKLPVPAEPVVGGVFQQFLGVVELVRSGAPEAEIEERLGKVAAQWPEAGRAAARAAAAMGKRVGKGLVAGETNRRRTFMAMGPVDPLWALLWRRSN
jgi:hypothetical protein